MTLTRRQKWILAAGGAAAAALAVLWVRLSAAPIQALIVEPFAGPAEFAEPLRDEVQDMLGRVRGLAIVKAPAPPPAVTGRFSATVVRAADRVRVVAELRREDGHRYWTRTFDRPLASLPGLPGEIAAAIHSKARPKKPYRPPLAAFDEYLKGRYAFDHPEHDGLATAVARFEDATRLDGGYAEAWAWLSIAKEYLADRGAVRPNLELPEAREAADRAGALDPDSAESHLALGIANLQYDWEWDKAKRELDRALQLSPSWPLAAYWRGRWDGAMGHGPAPPFDFANLPPIRNDDDARKLLADADDIRVETYISAAALALVANRIHDTEDTFRWLEEAYAERCVQLPYILWDPSLPRGDPRFDDLKRRMKLGGME